MKKSYLDNVFIWVVFKFGGDCGGMVDVWDLLLILRWDFNIFFLLVIWDDFWFMFMVEELFRDMWVEVIIELNIFVFFNFWIIICDKKKRWM